MLAEFADGKRRDLSHEATFTISNPKVARVENGMIVPTGDGSAIVAVHINGVSAAIPITVKQFAKELPTSFIREVLPVISKAGCNQGACHGAQLGRGGFRLSLFGFDPAFDYSQIVQSAEGRRVVVSDPERSILLLKPSLQMEHGGGERFKVNSPPHLTLKRWLEDGAPAPAPTDPTVEKIEVWPAKRIMAPNETQQLLVTATWSDGRREDVTATARFDALNDSVAAVTRDGFVTAKSRGETHIMVRFAGQAEVAQVTLPYENRRDKPVGSQFAKNNFIDEKLAVKWRDLGLSPSPLCSDEEFVRRIHLDAIGTLPDPDAVRKFLADKDPKKRDKAIDAVLQRPEFVDFWAYKWGDLLRINRTALEEKGMWSFHNWVRASLRDNKPVDEFVREIVLAEGSTFTEGPANFYRIGRNAEDWSESVAQVFLGVRMQCAKCHHHPFEKWTQDDYYGLTAFFVRLGTKNSQEFGIFGRETVVYLRPSGESVNPRTRKVVKPHPLDGAESEDPIDRRMKLAQWLTGKDNTMFSRNIVNRFWGYLMGRGLVEPLDDMRATNPPSDPESARRAGGRLCRAQVRFETSASYDHAIARVPVIVEDRRWQPGRRLEYLLHAVYGEAPDGGADRRRHRFCDRHAREVHRPAAGRAGHSVARSQCAFLSPGCLWPPCPPDHLRMRTHHQAEHRPGDAHAEWRLPEQEDRRPERPDRNEPQGEEANRRDRRGSLSRDPFAKAQARGIGEGAGVRERRLDPRRGAARPALGAAELTRVFVQSLTTTKHTKSTKSE